MEALSASFGTPGLILTEAELGPRFFDLKTRLAGELFQKCTNYNVRLAVVLPDRKQLSQPFQQLATEHDTHPHIRFFADRAAAAKWLHKPGQTKT